MEAQRFERRVYNGALTTGKYKISSIRYSPFSKGEKPRMITVDNLAQYESSCREHRQCFGHMCVTKSGTVLAPHSMSLRSNDIATDYHKAARMAFEGNTEEYIDTIKRTNYTKNGTMRSVMSTPIAGSCRLIATPQYEFGRGYIAISKNLASCMRVCRKVYDLDGNQEGAYVEGELRENDWVIVDRPPALNLGNTQPMRVKFWRHDCIGIHPESFSAFHGDFDGDEVQVYPVYSAEAILECESWDQIPSKAFIKGREIYNNHINEMSMNNTRDVPKCDDGDAHFLSYTTLSAAQIRDGVGSLVYGKYSRNKPEHISGMGKRFHDVSTEESFVDESIRGMGDVARQQLSQGALGDMTRVAKIAASCFYRPSEGGLYVVKRNGVELLRDDNIMDSGVPSIRAIANLCTVAQQAALDSHRAETHDVISHDFINDLIQGCNQKDVKGSTSGHTLIEFSLHEMNSEKVGGWLKWKHSSATSTFCLCKPSMIPNMYTKHIIGAYNPIVLEKIKLNISDTAKVCSRGIRTICNYYGMMMSEQELIDVSYVFSYEPGASVHPITSRLGMMARTLGWIETLEATDFTKLPLLSSGFEIPNTATAAMFMSNFNHLVRKHD